MFKMLQTLDDHNINIQCHSKTGIFKERTNFS
jgi:hypothetical protein